MRSRGPLWALAAATGLTLGIACSDGDGPMPDAGSDTRDGSVDPLGIMLPAPPEIPWFDLTTGASSLAPAPPGLTPCTGGWREVDGVCDPWPASGPADCPDGEAHFPGEPGCAAVGSPCPTGEFADGLPDDETVLFVRPGAAAGDGTRASPFGTIAEAMAAATPGVTLALAAGTFDERVRIAEGITLRGACTARTVVQWFGSGGSAIRADAPGTALSDLTVGGSSLPGIIVTGATAELQIDGVVVSGVNAVGFIIDSGASLRAHSIVIQDTDPRLDGAWGRALIVQEGSTAEISRASFERHREISVGVFTGSQLTLTDASIRDTEAAAAGTYGHGLWIADSANAALQRIEVVGSRTSAVRVEAAGSSLELTDVVLRGTRSGLSEGIRGHGLTSVNSQVRGSRLLIEGNRHSGVVAEGMGADVVLEDAVIRDTLPNEAAGAFGRGMEVAQGASATLRRARVSGNMADGIFALASTLTLEDVVVEDTTSHPGDNDGYGVSAVAGSTLDASRITLERNGSAGLIVYGLGTVATLRDVLVRDTRDEATGIDISGTGLDVRDGAHVTVERGVFDHNHVAAIAAAFEGSEVHLTDVVTRETRSRVENGLFGVGVTAQVGASIAALRVLAEGNHHVGVTAGQAGTVLVAEDLWIRDQHVAEGSGLGGDGILCSTGASCTLTRGLVERTHEVALSVTRDATLTMEHVTVRDALPVTLGQFGMGFGAYSGGSLSASRFRVTDAALCGVQVAQDSEMDLIAGEIAGNPIGVCVHIPDYDLLRLTDGVRFRDNDVNIETVDFAVPDPDVSLGGL